MSKEKEKLFISKIIEELDLVESTTLNSNLDDLGWDSLAVITDSGGITEETTVLGIPCLTLRDNTERPETVEIGTNMLVGSSPDKLKDIFEKIKYEDFKVGKIPKKWDGKTAKRIIKILNKLASNE